MKKFNYKSKLGFTLIELLVVIGILAVLAAIAIPAVAGLIDRANVSADDTNANEMTNSVERFVSEYELFKQDIASGKFDKTKMDSAQGRVYAVTGVEDRAGIEALESTGTADGIYINIDTKYPLNEKTLKRVVNNYMKTSASTFTPKQSDCSYYYSPALGTVVCTKTGSTMEDISAIVLSYDSANVVKNSTTLATEETGETVEWMSLTLNATVPEEEWTDVIYATETTNVYKPFTFLPDELNPELNPSGIIPEGGKYTTVDGVVYVAGDNFPESVSTGDIFTFAEYEYRYNYHRYHTTNNGTANWVIAEELNGWGVFMATKRANNDYIRNPSPLFVSINNKPIVSLQYAFYCADRIQTIPKIPSFVTNMEGVFECCSSLKNVRNLNIPDGVTNLNYAFKRCGSLEEAPLIPAQITDINSIFYRCKKLKTYVGSGDADGDFSNYVLPHGVTSLRESFRDCEALVVTPKIPDGVTGVTGTFFGCKSLTTITNLPEGIGDFYQTFYGCKSLVEVPKFPESTWRLYETFRGCTSLEKLQDFPTTEDLWLNDCFIGCTSLKTIPTIPSNVVYMGQAFMNCTSLTGEIRIEVDHNINQYDCFKGVDFEAQDITLVGNDAYLDGFGKTGTNYCEGCNGRHKQAE